MKSRTLLAIAALGIYLAAPFAADAEVQHFRNTIRVGEKKVVVKTTCYGGRCNTKVLDRSAPRPVRDPTWGNDGVLAGILFGDGSNKLRQISDDRPFGGLFGTLLWGTRNIDPEHFAAQREAGVTVRPLR